MVGGVVRDKPDINAHVLGCGGTFGLVKHNADAAGGLHVGGLLEPCAAAVDDKGDQPPITPTRSLKRHQLHSNDEWKVYELVARNWLASLSPSLKYEEYTANVSIGGEMFTYSWHSIPSSSQRLRRNSQRSALQ